LCIVLTATVVPSQFALNTSPKDPSPTFSSNLISFHLISHSYSFSFLASRKLKLMLRCRSEAREIDVSHGTSGRFVPRLAPLLSSFRSPPPSPQPACRLGAKRTFPQVVEVPRSKFPIRLLCPDFSLYADGVSLREGKGWGGMGRL
jgi:hypothetical protein